MRYLLLLLVLFFCAGCNESQIETEPEVETTTVTVEIKIASWNLQTFFDAVKVGTEYSEFISKKSSWSEEKYKVRLNRLCEILELIDADIFVMQEIENEGILYDIINNYRLQGRRDKAYLYGAFIGEKNQAFGCGVLSKIPLYNLKSHQLDIKTENEEQPDMRPLMEFSVDEKNTKRIFVCHWKSKSGGEKETELWRNYQQKLLSKVLQVSQSNFVICGDFNKDIKDFSIKNEKVVFQDDKTDICLKSGWLTFSSEETGSYFYQNQWEKIDHFFVSENCQIKEFYTIKNGPNITEEGTPFRYNLWSGEGYSDHLPIVCTVIF
jgi:endonuclease/exonuclease/phosphatase family metal-dependent hydrolase